MMPSNKPLSRRQFLRDAAGVIGATSVGAILSACAPPAAPPAASKATAPAAANATLAPTSAPSTAKEATLQVWSIWDLEKEMKVSEIYGIFSQQNPGLKVEHTFVPGDNWETKFRTSAAANQLPDVFTTDGINIPTYACKGLLADLTPIIPAEVRQDYFRPVMEEMTWNGKQWTAPIENHAQGVYYNKDMLDAAGVTFPTTWDDLLAAAKATTNADKGVFGFEFPIGRNEYVMWWMSTFLWQNKARVTDEQEKKATINDPNAVDAIQFFQDLVNKHKVSPKAGQIQAGPEGTFRGQRVAMSCSGSWGIQDTQKNPPKFNWGWGFIPYSAKGANVQGISAGWHWTMWAQGKNKDAAGKLMSFKTSEDWLIPVAQRFRAITPRKSVAAKLPLLKTDPWNKCIDAISNYGFVTRPRNVQYPLVTDAAQAGIDNAITGNMPVKATLDEAATKINDALSQPAQCVAS